MPSKSIRIGIWAMAGMGMALRCILTITMAMLVQVLKTASKVDQGYENDYQEARERRRRYARHQERLISPEGTYPPIGRSITYRIGVFQPLAEVALLEDLPEDISPAQVRCALTKVMQNQFEAEGTFDEEGWLQIGSCGHQPEIGDPYISTGSLYLCTLGFLPLGLRSYTSILDRD